MTTRQNSCLTPVIELCISMSYLIQSLSAMLKFPSNTVKNLGFTLDSHLSMNAHVSNIARICYFELRRLASILRFLTSTAIATLVSAFALSRIDYCSSLLFGSIHDMTSHLQWVQNYAARVILRLQKSFNIATHLKSLHWFPVKIRSTYKWTVCATTETAVLHHHISLRCCRSSHHTPATLTPAQAPCLFSMDLHTVGQHFVVVRFLLLSLLSGTPFQMMSVVPHHCHYHVSFEDILVSFSLQRQNFLFDRCTYVHGLSLPLFCWWPSLYMHLCVKKKKSC